MIPRRRASCSRLAVEHHVVGVVCPIDEDRVARLIGEFFQQGPKRGDADAAGKHRDLAGDPPLTGEPAVRPFDHDLGARAQPGQPAASVTGRLGSHPQAIRSRRGRQRVGISPRPSRAVEEPEDEVLTGPDRHPVQAAAGQQHRHDARALANHFANRQSVPKRSPQRQGSARRAGSRRAPRRTPTTSTAARDPRRREVHARPDLVRHGQPDPEIGVQVQQVPRLVPQRPASHRTDVTTTTVNARLPATASSIPPYVVTTSISTHQIVVIAQRVAAEDESDVDHQQVERPEADQPVSADQFVLTVAALDHRHPGHQEHLHQQQVRGHQTGQPAERRRQIGRPGGRHLDTTSRQPQDDDHQDAAPAQGTDHASRHQTGVREVRRRRCTLRCRLVACAGPRFVMLRRCPRNLRPSLDRFPRSPAGPARTSRRPRGASRSWPP